MHTRLIGIARSSGAIIVAWCTIFLLTLPLASCSGKPEFVQSSSIHNLVLFKSPPDNIAESKALIEKYLLENFGTHKDTPVYLYKYTSRTEYFLTHSEDPGGFSSEELSKHQNEDGIAIFGFIKCESNPNKANAIIRYYNEAYGDYHTPGILIKNC